MAGGWVRFDEYEDVLASTDLLAMVAPNLQRHPSNWKWMSLAAQNGLQGALVVQSKIPAARKHAPKNKFSHPRLRLGCEMADRHQ